MEIGTAQPTKAERKSIPTHLIGIRSPEETITAGEYAHLVKHCVADIQERGMKPIICGGSGLYYRAITKGIFDGSKSDTEIRSKLEMEYNAKGGEVLLERLTVIDPEYAKIVHQNNRKRLIRALEIYEITGKSPSEHFHTQEESKSNNVHVFTIFLNSAMSELENRIQERTEHMLKNGWITEVKNLKEKFPEVTLHPLDSIGYRQILDHLDNKLAYEDMVKEIHLRTRQYAKKQIQWFKNECCDLTLDVSQKTNYAQQIEKIINKWKTLSKKTPETK